MELSRKQGLFYLFPALFCFCLPFGSLLLSGLVVLWTVVSFFNIDVDQFKKGLKDKNLWLSFAFFFLSVISASFSSNKTEAGFGIEIKMSFLVVPYLFYCFKWPVQIIKRCLVSFVSGCFFACLALIIRGAYYAFNGHAEYLFYTPFSVFIHPSYFAMYLILAIAIIVMLYHDWFKSQKTVAYTSYFILVSFIVTVFLCGSKLGLISFFITMPLILLYKFREFLSIKTAAILVVVLFVLGGVSYKAFPGAFERLSSLTTVSLVTLDKTSSESTTVRILIWEQCMNIVRSNFWLGTGVGDVNDELYKAYEANGLTGALEHKLNTHNQYFQTFIGLGLLGFILLVFMTFGALISSIKRKHFLLFIFSLLIILNFMVESMLQTSAGVLFFAFFSCFFDKVTEAQLRDESEPLTANLTVN